MDLFISYDYTLSLILSISFFFFPSPSCSLFSLLCFIVLTILSLVLTCHSQPTLKPLENFKWRLFHIGFKLTTGVVYFVSRIVTPVHPLFTSFPNFFSNETQNLALVFSVGHPHSLHGSPSCSSSMLSRFIIFDVALRRCRTILKQVSCL